MFSKIFANFYVYMLTHNALQQLSFSLIFLASMSKVLSPSLQHVFPVEVQIIEDRIFFPENTWIYSFADSVYFCPKCVGPAHTETDYQTCDQDTCICLASNWAIQQYGSGECIQTVNVSCGLYKGFITND